MPAEEHPLIREISISRIAVVAALCSFCVVSAQANSFRINPTFDVSITSLANAADVESRILDTIAIFQATFQDPITVNIIFKDMNSGLGQSEFQVSDIPYSTFLAAVGADSTSADDATAFSRLAASPLNPVTGTGDIIAKSANLKALGIFGPNTASDGTISLNTSILNIFRTGPQDPNFYDLQAVASHEIDEILGLGSTLGLNFQAPDTRMNNVPSPEDFFRYDNTGNRSFTASTSAVSYFSIDGVALLAQFNNTGFADYGDWANAGSPRVQDGFGNPGAQPNLGVEIRALDVIGYNLVSVPEPSTWLLVFTGLLTGMIYRTRQRILQPVTVAARYNKGK